MDRVEPVDHDLNECVSRVTNSSAACRNVLKELAVLAKAGTLADDPKWTSTLAAFEKVQVALVERRRHRYWR